MESKRYRSTRRRPNPPQTQYQAEDAALDANGPNTSRGSNTSSTGVARQPSRYYRNRATTLDATSSAYTPYVPPVPDIPPGVAVASSTAMPGQQHLQPQAQTLQRPHTSRRATDDSLYRSRTGSGPKISGEWDRSRPYMTSDAVAAADYKNSRHTLDSKQAKAETTSTSPPEKDSLVKRFGRLRMKKNDVMPPKVQVESSGQSRTVSAESSSSGTEAYTFIKAGGGGAVPGTDAPKSAVNAGDRYVTIECGRASVSLPVTPTTTVSDLIKSAANYLSEAVDPYSSVLLESFAKVGVQRPLRKYEHVRDVMNSWDHDDQNVLVLVESATGGQDRDLYASSVSKQRPGTGSFWLYQSQKVGKWDKRWVTLREDGQITLSRSEFSNEVVNSSNLSDYDIYSPMPKQLSRKIRPPKKVCFAIRSQEKLSFFASSENYVQFFCTNDKKVATEFYTAVQRWRSWYLVSVMGEGQRKSIIGFPARLGFGRTSSLDSSSRSNSIRAVPRTNSDPAAWKSLRSEEQRAMDSREMYNWKRSLRTKAPPPVSFPGYVSQEAEVSSPRRRQFNGTAQSNSQSNPQPITDKNGFPPSSLLGTQYQLKQEHQREQGGANGIFRSPSQKVSDNVQRPKTAGGADRAHDNDNNNNQATLPRRSQSVRSHHTRTNNGTDPGTRAEHNDKNKDIPVDDDNEFTALRRNHSVRQAEVTKPLIDLTPQQHVPPQHQRKGRAYVPEQVGARGLIENATSPGDAIAIPPSVDWRAKGGYEQKKKEDFGGVVESVGGGGTAARESRYHRAEGNGVLPASATTPEATHAATGGTGTTTPTLPAKSAKRSTSIRRPQQRYHNSPAAITAVTAADLVAATTLSKSSHPDRPVPSSTIGNNTATNITDGNTINTNGIPNINHIQPLRPYTSTGTSTSTPNIPNTNNNKNNMIPLPQPRPPTTPATPKTQTPFLKQSLLATSGPSQGPAGTGRGVMSGAHATGPMLDLREEGPFAKGSLLGGVVERGG